MDEQSNQSLARSDFFYIFSVKGGTEVYTLKTCSGIMEVRGRKAKDFIVESIDGHIKVPLPPKLECDMIPEDCSDTYQVIQTDNLGDNIFIRREDDEKLAPSQQDVQFLKIMKKEMYQDETNSWVAPLSFVTPR